MSDVTKFKPVTIPGLEGWCSPQKAGALTHYILSEKANCCVEIGVFGGSSLVPQALALSQLGRGRIYGIDPYSKERVLDYMDHQADIDWWSSIDLKIIKQGLLNKLDKLKLNNYVELIEEESTHAVVSFADNSIDVLHIDGNHSKTQSYRDAIDWTRKVKPGGVIFVDDISWGFGPGKAATTGPAIDYILRACTWIGVIDECLICRKHL